MDDLKPLLAVGFLALVFLWEHRVTLALLFMAYELFVIIDRLNLASGNLYEILEVLRAERADKRPRMRAEIERAEKLEEAEAWVDDFDESKK